MRIATIVQSYPPAISGASLISQSLAEGMARRGHEVLVLAASDRRVPYRNTQGSLRVEFLRSQPNPLRARQNFFSWWNPALKPHLRKFRPQILHLHDPLTVGPVWLSANKDWGIPVVVTIHQLPWFVSAYLPDLPGFRSSVERLLWAYGSWVDRRSQHMVTPTKTIAEEIEKCGGFRPSVIDNGVDLDLFYPAAGHTDDSRSLFQKYGLDPALPVILHVGRLDQEKRVDLVLRAAARAMARAPAQLLVVGDGKERTRLVELAVTLRIWERTRFTGFIANDGDLPALYRHADVFALASEIETQGIVLLEAMASGLPVVAVAATCIPEVVHHGENGYLVAPGDDGSMAGWLEAILADPDRRRCLGMAGRRVAQGHSRCVCLDQYESLYERLAATYPVPETVFRRRFRWVSAAF